MKDQESWSKIKYLQCKNKLHEGQKLNLVCIDKKCKNSGLICSICRTEHEKHRIIPLKIVLDNLKKNAANPLESDSYCDRLQELENIKQVILYEIKCTVQQLAQNFKKLEQDVIDTYTKIKTEIIQQIQLSFEMSDIASLSLNGPKEPSQYLSNFSKLSKWIHENNDQIVFSLNLDQFVNPFYQTKIATINKLKKISTFCLQSLKEEVKEALVIDSSQKSQEIGGYIFSSQYKGASITLNQSNTVATQSSSAASRFVLIEKGMGLKEKKISFKVHHLANWVGIGVCMRNKIQSISYAFKYQQLGHGSYLLSNNGYTWSHSSADDNIYPCLFTFKSGQIIDVTLRPTEIIFYNRESSTSWKLKINYKEEQWPEVCFCANLCSGGDAIQIVNQ